MEKGSILFLSECEVWVQHTIGHVLFGREVKEGRDIGTGENTKHKKGCSLYIQIHRNSKLKKVYVEKERWAACYQLRVQLGR